MSIVSQLIAAFKKGAEGKDPNWPPPPVGPRDVPGTDSPQDDGREFRNPPQDPLPPTGTGGVQPPLASSDPEEGGEVLGGIKVEGAYKVEGVEPSIVSSDPEEGGELTTAPRGELDLASIEGADELESAESSSDERQRRPLTQVEQEGGDPPDDGEGPHLVQRTPGSPDEEDSGEGELVGLADRRGAGVSDPRDPVQIFGAVDKDSIDKVAAEPVAGVKLEGDYKAGDLALAEDLDVTPIDGGGGGGMATGRPEDYTPNSGDGQATGRPEDYTPDSGAGNTTGRPEDYTPNSGDGQATGRPEGNVPGSEAESGGEAEALIRPLPEFKVDDLSVAPIDDGGEVFSEVKFKIEPAYLKFGEYKVEPEPDGDLKVEGGIKFEGGKGDDTHKVEGVAPPTASSDPDDGDQLTREIQPATGGGYIGETEKNLISFSSDPQEGGEVGPGDMLRRTPGPLTAGEPQDGGDWDEVGPGDLLRRRVGGEEFFKVKMEEVVVSSAIDPAAPAPTPVPYPVSDEPPDDEGSGVTDWIAKKRGKGGLGFSDVKAEEAVISQETSGGIDGESQDKDHKVGIEFARRTEVKDSHDRFSNVGSEEPKTVAELADDDDFESSSLLDLKPEPDVKGMLPGLAGELPDDAELGFDLDDDLDDTDESEF